MIIYLNIIKWEMRYLHIIKGDSRVSCIYNLIFDRASSS